MDRDSAEWKSREARARARGRFRDPVLEADQYRWWEKSDLFTWPEWAECMVALLCAYVVCPVMLVIALSRLL
jgi:hypothetical protein